MHLHFKHIILFLLFLTSATAVVAQELPKNGTPIPAKKPKIEEKKETELPKERVIQVPMVQNDSVVNDSVKKPKAFLEYRIESSAKDYKRIDRKGNTITLYNEAKIVYGDITIEAGKIVINNTTGDVFAYGIVKDSLGYTQKPVFSQGTNIIKPDSIIFNKNSQKALTFNSRTTQGEFNVVAETTKKVNDSVIYMQNARFTTSKNPENPEYYFFARKIKFVPKKKIVTGLVNMYIADVPTPLGLPFAFFPMTTETSESGVILPNFGNNNSQGYFLQNGGYYFAVSDYMDLTLLGDYFTNGSYGGRVESNYKARYKYNGSVRFLYENQLQSERGFSDFAQTSRYNLNWQHAQDGKSNPSSRFSASVNLGSSQFFRQSFNLVNQSATLVNNLSSSISYSKAFPGEPQVNFSASVTHNQNTNTDVVNLTLPTLQGSVSRVFPFAPKDGTKKGVIENINLQYNLRGENRIATTNEDFFTDKMFDSAVMGLQHSIPIATNFKAGYFSFSANANYEENWVFETYRQSLVENESGAFETARDTINGFDAYRTYSYGASVGTTIYGSWKSKNPESKVQAIRHIIRPNISYAANPSFDQYYDRLVTEQGMDAPGREEQFYSRFNGTLFGAPGRNFSSSINLGIQNNIEAKVRDRDSTKTELKKIQILKSLSFNTSYNLAGDSLNWSPLSVRGVIPITKNIDINLDANFDPYALDNNNNRIDTFNVNNGGSLLRLTRAGLRTSFRLSSTDFEKYTDTEDSDERTLQNGGRDDDLFGASIDYSREQDQEPEKQDVDVHKDRYRFKIPWSLNFVYTMTYNNAQRQNAINQQSLMISGDIELSPRWTVGGNTGYDFANRGISFSTLRFQRDLESFTMSFNWTPIGPRNSWFFFIGIKASALSDIKWDQRKQPDPTF